MKIKHFPLLILIMLLTTGCPEDILPLTPIPTDKNKITIPPDGGCDTITMLAEHEIWWIGVIHIQKTENTFNETCHCQTTKIVEEQRYYYAAQRNGIKLDNLGWYDLPDSTQFDASGVKISIPPNEPKKIMIECGANESEYERCIVVELCVPNQKDEVCELEIFQDSMSDRDLY